MSRSADAEFLEAASTGQSHIVTSVLADLSAEEKRRIMLVTTAQGHTALHAAAFGGHASVVNVLLAAGADRDVKTQYGKTALDYAEQQCQHEVVKLLNPPRRPSLTERIKSGLHISPPGFGRRKSPPGKQPDTKYEVNVPVPEPIKGATPPMMRPPAANKTKAKAPSPSRFLDDSDDGDDNAAFDSDSDVDAGDAFRELSAAAGLDTTEGFSSAGGGGGLRPPPGAQSTSAAGARRYSFSKEKGGGTVPTDMKKKERCGRRARRRRRRAVPRPPPAAHRSLATAPRAGGRPSTSRCSSARRIAASTAAPTSVSRGRKGVCAKGASRERGPTSSPAATRRSSRTAAPAVPRPRG